MKDMVKVEFPSKKALSQEGPELWHLCQVKYFAVMKSEPTTHDISIDAGLPIEWGAYPPPRSILSVRARILNEPQRSTPLCLMMLYSYTTVCCPPQSWWFRAKPDIWVWPNMDFWRRGLSSEICILGNWGYKGQVLFLQIDLLGKLPKKFYF